MRPSVSRMWMEFCATSSLSPGVPLPPVWHFCDTEKDADICAALVVGGQKRATAPSLWGLAHRGEPVPVVGGLDLVTTWNGEACAIIRTTRVEIHPFVEVSAEHAIAEGEGDRSLAWWRNAHRAYYERELAGTPYTPSDDMPVVCQYFELVYPAGAPPPSTESLPDAHRKGR
jgi:uncharacterized protein YhfF